MGLTLCPSSSLEMVSKAWGEGQRAGDGDGHSVIQQTSPDHCWDQASAGYLEWRHRVNEAVVLPSGSSQTSEGDRHNDTVMTHDINTLKEEVQRAGRV